jgi:uncharacterized alkaline shock family protein YloU
VEQERPHISTEVLARYAADAALEVDGVEGLVKERVRRHEGVRVSESDGSLEVEVHLRVASGTSLPALGREVQDRVAAYLERMAGSAPSVVDVFVREIG